MATSRRTFLKNGLLTAASASLWWKAPAVGNALTRYGSAAIQGAASAFMQQHSVPGLSVAVARRGDIFYEAALGFADRDKGERLTPSHQLRIASVSKPITSVAIFTLIEQGRLSLENVIFGPGGLLRGDFGSPPYELYVEQIRLKHLLTHTAGGWENDRNDPMFQHPGMSHGQLITWALGNAPITSPPGQRFAYSNFGYCILGRIIEKVTQQSYSNYVRESILIKFNATGMQISGNTRDERTRREAVYYDQGGADPYTMNVRRMDAHGGWLATASDLVRFASSVDGLSPERNILKPASIRDRTYARAILTDGDFSCSIR
jgi:CubicO group peptidase (beta-lactamase class C family)